MAEMRYTLANDLDVSVDYTLNHNGDVLISWISPVGMPYLAAAVDAIEMDAIMAAAAEHAWGAVVD